MGQVTMGRWSIGTLVTLVLTAGLLVLSRGVRGAGAEPGSTLQRLADRAAIEDLLVDYYGQLGGRDEDLGHYYTDDGVLDVNGIIARGRKPIEALYAGIAQGSPRLQGTFHMLLTNPKVVVQGSSATADVIWTGVISQSVQSAPRFVEQGREHDELIKQDGRWYFSHRVITSDGGLPAMFQKTYRKR